MAETNGPAKAGDTATTPEPAGGEAKPEAVTAEDVETPTSKPGDAGGFSLDKDAQD